MEHYVTLFDSLFLPQGLALHASMERHAGAYTLWIVCMDEEAFGPLQKLALPNVRLMFIDTIETVEMKAVRPSRSRGEYCWTATPFVPGFVFEADRSVSRVTYLDADVWLTKSPAPIFREFDSSGKAVLITDHAYAPEYDQSATSGQYCVQFMTFVRDRGEVVRQWWAERCLEWCYARFEEGKFGDQKYLDDWPERFPDTVHVLQRQEWMLAPWNSIRFPFSGAILHHFHALRIVDEENYVLTGYAVPPVVHKYVYLPYLADLKEACGILRQVGHTLRSQGAVSKRSKFGRIKELISSLKEFRWRYSPDRLLKL